MISITERLFMQELRDTAIGMCAGNLNPDWVRAYEALADAADRLDAMQARCEIPPREVGEPTSRKMYQRHNPCNKPQVKRSVTQSDLIALL